VDAVLWIVLAVALAIGEAFTATLLVIMFAAGALAASLESGETAFGVEAIEGSHATVLEEVDGDRGMVKIDGEMWQARSFDGDEKYLPGERVRVIKVRGATAIVWRDNLPNI
jgi:membrane protein implicated in regulation of membrane protease activity